MNSRSALLTAAFLLRSPLNSKARSSNSGSIDKFVAMCKPPHMILHNSASKLNQYWKFCEIKYRERVVNLASNRSNFLNEEYEPSVLVDKIHDLALSQKQSFLLDGTLGNYAKAEENIVRSLKRRRLDQILYVYQKPMLAWNFVMDREVVEGGKINPKDFITQYF